MFKLTDGACPKSYGPTVARAAGIPASVAERAIEISDAFEAGHHAAVLGTELTAPSAAVARRAAPAEQAGGEGDAGAADGDDQVAFEFKALWGQMQGECKAQQVMDLAARASKVMLE